MIELIIEFMRKARYPQRFRMQKLRCGRSAIGRHVTAPVCQLITHRPPRDFRVCKTLRILGINQYP